MPVDMLIGNNGHEISVFKSPASGGPRGLGGDSVKETIRLFYGSRASIVVGAFLFDNTLHRTEAADSWINDVVCTCPEMAMSALQAETGRRTYVYQFLRSIPGKGQESLGSFHSLEVPYVFGGFRLPEWNWLPFEPIDLALGESIRNYWSNFAKTGNPNGPNLPDWPTFDVKTETAMEFTQQGKAVARAHSRPSLCDLDVGALKRRLKEPAPRTAQVNQSSK
jgi:carboxylesterase type B